MIKYRKGITLGLSITFLMLLIRFQSYLENPFISDNIFVILYIVGMFSYFLYKEIKRGFSRINIVFYIFLLFLSYIFIFGYIFPNNRYQSFINDNVRQYCTWLLLLFLIVYYVIINKCMFDIIKVSYLAVSLLALILYILNFDHFSIFSHLSSIFISDPSSRYRVAFGFSHPNNCADFCLLGIALSCLLRSANQHLNLFWTFSDAIKILMLLSTSSRGNIIGLLILGAGYLYISLDQIFTSVKQGDLHNIKRFFIICSIVIFSIYIYYSRAINFSQAFVDSNRSYNFTINLPKLISSGRIWTGIGFIASSVFGSDKLQGGFTFIDNYYLYVFVSTGIIGSVIMIIVFVISIIQLMNYKYKDTKFYQVFILVQIMQLFIALFESQIFTHTFPSSLVYSIILFSFIGLNNEPPINK